MTFSMHLARAYPQSRVYRRSVERRVRWHPFKNQLQSACHALERLLLERLVSQHSGSRRFRPCYVSLV